MNTVLSRADELLSRLSALGLEKRLPELAALLLTIMLAQSLAVLTWGLLPKLEVEEKTLLMPSTRATIRARVTGQNQAKQISQWHLFGQIQKSSPAAVVIAKCMGHERRSLIQAR